MNQPQRNIIELDQQGTASLLLRDIRTPCLFKIKTNVPNAVETKPAYGIIEKGAQGSTIAMRYKGNITDIDKVAVKVCMLAISPQEEYMDPSQILPRYKQIQQSGNVKEVHLLYRFSFKSDQPSQMREFRFKKLDFIKKNHITIDIKNIKQQQKIKNSQTFLKKIEQQQTIPKNTSLYNCNTTMAFILAVAFVLGVVTGVWISPSLNTFGSFVGQNASK